MPLPAPEYRTPMRDLGKIAGSLKKALSFFSDQDFGPFPQNAGVGAVDARRFLASLGYEFPRRTVAFMNLKGGIGKTTSCVTAATRAMQYGFKTCVLDMDAQGSASIAFDRVPEADDPIFIDVWQTPQDMIPGALKNVAESLSILPSALENGLLEAALANPAAQKNAVAGVRDALFEHEYDLVLIDCPPSLGTAVISSICAADAIVVPMGFDAYSQKGLELTLGEIKAITETFGLPAPDVRILFTGLDRRIKHANQAVQEVTEQYPEMVMPSPIRTSTEFARALDRRETVFAQNKKSTAREDYDAFVRDLFQLDIS